MSVTVCAIVASYNRPRMLRAALASVVAARPDEVILVDDGSDAFDAHRLFTVALDGAANAHGQPIICRIVTAPPVTIDERMTTPRHGGLLNQALALVTSDVVSYLCDDDLFAPGWCDALRAAWAAEPERRIVRGAWLVFDDGDTPSADDPPCPLDTTRGMTCGNFAHHASLTRDRGARWDETRLNCLDDAFLHALHAAGADTFRVPVVGFAGWARRHAYQNGHYAIENRHTEAFRAVLAGGVMEAAR